MKIKVVYQFLLGFDDETEDQQLRLYAVQSYLTLLDVENVFYPQRFLQVMSWVSKVHLVINVDNIIFYKIKY